MHEGIEITVRNKLVNEKRDLNIYHRSDRSAYMISHGRSITIPLGAVEEGDYLYLSIVSGPGSMGKDYWINLPSWCDFTIAGLGNGDLTHSGDRTLLKIPPGPPLWQLKIIPPSGHMNIPIDDCIIVGDSEHKQG